MREQELKLEKVKKSCRTAKNITKAIKILMLVCAIVCVVGAIVVFVESDAINSFLLANLDHIILENLQSGGGILQFDMDTQELIEQEGYAIAICIYCIAVAGVSLITSVLFGAISKIFKTMEISESPFHEDVIRKLKKIFIAITIITGLFVGVGTALLLGLFLWCIYCILDYGAVLQNEVDETV